MGWWVDALMSWIDELMSWRVESMSWNAEKAPKRPPERPKTTLRGAQDDQKRPQEEPKTTKKAIPNDKTKKGPNQDDLWTVLDRPGADLPTIHALPGCHLGGQNGTKIDPKTIKNQNDKKSDPER